MDGDWEGQQRRWTARRLLMPLGLALTGVVAGLVDVGPPTSRDVPVTVAEASEVAARPTQGAPDWQSAPGGRWVTVDGGPLSSRNDAAVVAAGDRVVVWGGSGSNGRGTVSDGAVFDVATHEWEPIGPAPLRPRTKPAAAWTGDEVVVWGGTAAGKPVDDGAAYNPHTDRWRRLAPSPLTARHDAAAVWAGSQLIVWGGVGDPNPWRLTDGAAYDPSTDRWRRLPPGPLAGRRDSDVSAVGLDGGMFVWSSSSQDAMAAFYDPGTGQWRELATPRFVPGSGPRFAEVAGAVLGWGTAAFGDGGPLVLTFTTNPDWWATAAVPRQAPAPGTSLVGDAATAVAWPPSQPGFSFDVLTNRWDVMARSLQPQVVGSTFPVMVDGSLFVWHGSARPADPHRAQLWDPANRWQPVTGSPVALEDDVSGLWSGWLERQQRVLLYSGGGRAAGAAFDPALRLWEAMPDHPGARRVDPATAWTGTEMVVLGGRHHGGGPRRDAVAYDPDRRRWRGLPRLPMATARGAAAWDGTRVYAAGSRRGAVAVASLDPTENRWVPLPDPPLRRSYGRIDIVWNALEVWVWTTDADGARHGAAWDPARREWRRLPDPPPLLAPASIVWGGRRLFALDRVGKTASLGRGTDGWRDHPRLPGTTDPVALAWNGRRLIAYAPRSKAVASLDPNASRWAPAPWPALPSAATAELVWTGRQLFVVAGGEVAVLGVDE